MWVIKYKVNDNDWKTNTNQYEINTFTDPFCVDVSATEEYIRGLGRPVYALTSLDILESNPIYMESVDVEETHLKTQSRFHALHTDNIPESLKPFTKFGKYAITVQKMTKKELEKFPEHTDIFGWIKQQVANTTDVPEGFELPIVTDNSITIVSHAMIDIT